MTAQASLASRTLGSRATLVGLGRSLQNVNTFSLDDGARCYVTEDHAEWRLDRESSVSPDGTTVIAPSAGPGRWLKVAGGSGGDTFQVKVTEGDPEAGYLIDKISPGQGVVISAIDSPPAPELLQLDVSSGIPSASDIGGPTVTDDLNTLNAAINAFLPRLVGEPYVFSGVVSENQGLIAPSVGVGLYLVSASLLVTVPSSSGAVKIVIGSNDIANRNSDVGSIVTLSAGQLTQGSVVIQCSQGSPIAWATVITTPIVGGPPQAQIKITATQLSAG